MLKRLFNHLTKSRRLRRSKRSPVGFVTLVRINNKFSLQDYGVSASKHTAFLNHTIQPLYIRNKFYTQMQFIFGLPYFLRRGRIVFRENKSFDYSQYETKILTRFVNNILYLQRVSQTIQGSQEKISNLSLLMPVINKTLNSYDTKKSVQKVLRDAIKTSIAKPEKFKRFFQSHLQSAKRLIMPGSIKERANQHETAQLGDHNHQAEYKISPDFVEKRNFQDIFIQKNILNKVNYLQKSYVCNAQTQTFKETKNLLQDSRRSLSKLFAQLMSRAFIKHENEVLERIKVNDVTTIVEKSRDVRSKPLIKIQQYSILPAVKSSLVTSFEQKKLSRLIRQSQQAQVNITHAAEKQKTLQQPPDLIHPHPAAVTTAAHKNASETISDSKQHMAFSLPRPAGIADAAKFNNFTDLGELTDKVMEQIEQRIKTERERRGIFV
jgi:hypothetical protein